MIRIISCLFIWMLIVFSAQSQIQKQDLQLSQNYILAKKYFDEASFHKSIRLYKEIAVIEKGRNNWHGYTESSNSIGEAYFYIGEYDSAIQYFNSIINLNQVYHFSDSAQAQAHSSIGSCLLMKGDLSEAKGHLDKAVESIKSLKGSNDVSLYGAYSSLGWYYSRTGDFPNQLKTYEEALRILRLQFIDSVIENLPEAYNNIAQAYWNLGDLETQLIYLKKSLETFEYQKKLYLLKKRSIKNLELQQATTFNNIGLCYGNLGNRDLAKLYLIKALNIRKQLLGDKNDMVAQAYNNLSDFVGSFNEQIKLLNKSLAIDLSLFGMNHPDVAQGYFNIGTAYYDHGKPDSTLKYYRKALNIYQSIYGENNQDVIDCYTGIATIFEDKNRSDSCLSYLLKARDIAVDVLPDKHPKKGRVFYLICKWYGRNGDFQKALEWDQKALIALVRNYSDTNFMSNPPLQNVIYDEGLLEVLDTKILGLRSLYRKDTNQTYLDFALNTLNLSLNLMDSIRYRIQSSNAKLFFSEHYYHTVEQGNGIAFDLYTVTKQDKYLKQAFSMSEHSKALTLLDAVNESKAKKSAGIPDSLLQNIKAAASTLEAYERNLARANISENQRQDYQSKLFDTRTQYNNLIDQLEKQYPRYYSLKYKTFDYTVETLQSKLADSTCIISYFVTNNSVYGFLIGKSSFQAFSKKIEDGVSSLVKKYLSSINKGEFSKEDKENFISISYKLYDLLIAPFALHLKNKHQIIIIPEGQLNYVPFETLITDSVNTGKDIASLNFLLKKFEISYHYSTNLLCDLSDIKGQKTNNGFIGFAPIFDEKGRNGYIIKANLDNIRRSIADTISSDIIINRNGVVPLPYSKEEIENIIALFKKEAQPAIGYLYREANEANIKSRIGSYKYVHFATHGIVNDERPELSGLVFSPLGGSKRQEEDGMLYAGEMYNLNLENTDLVVLSACETGIGKLVNGEGLIGMTRGLIYSGAPNIIFSLWRVPDKPTKELMVNFYEGVLRGLPYEQALRNAKLKILQSTEMSFPKNWAGFALIGNSLAPK